MDKKEVIGLLDGNTSEGCVSEGCGGEFYADVKEENFKEIINSIKSKSLILVNLFCAENFEGYFGFTLFYVFEKRGDRNFIILKRRIEKDKTTSICEDYPAAYWYEREITDGFGVSFRGIFDDQRLFLHESYPADFHPLQKSFTNRKIEVKKTILPQEEYGFKNVFGEGVYQIPVGPVHAGIIEPGHFRFSVIGEPILNLEVRMFYKHRGVEKIAEGKTPHECVKIAESISGDETIANSAAFCSAVEKISKIEVPERAIYLRTVFLEMERIYSHLGDLAGMTVDVAFPVGASPFFILREETFRHNDMLTGSRFMKGIMDVGGLKKDVSSEALSNLSVFLNKFTKRFDEALDIVRSSPSVLDRFERTGVVKKELVSTLNLTGPVARASETAIDTRIDHPYGIYEKIKPSIKVMGEGDVKTRFEVKASEIIDSANIIQKLINEMPGGSVNSKYKISDGFSLSVLESPRGQNVHWVYVKNGLVDRYKVRTPSFCNWRAIEHAVIGDIVPDFPLINKSMNLSYAGTDL